MRPKKEASVIPKPQWTQEMKDEGRQLDERFKELLESLDRNPGQYLHHYTSSQTLKKILKSQKIRLYDVYTFEDTEEFRYPLRMIWEEMQPHWGRLDVKLSGLFRPGCYADLENAVPAVAACFCEADESMYMWRSYGDCFRGASIRINAASFRATQDLAVFPVVYDAVQEGSG